MLRTMVLLATHLTMLFAGIGLALITVRARRQATLAREVALDVRELFLTETIEKRTARVRAEAATPSAGRHRARPVPALTLIQPPTSANAPSLLTASLAEAQVILGTQRAQRVQERRQFADLMTSLVGTARIRQHAVGVARVA